MDDMGDKRKRYTKEFKLEAVRMLEAGEKSGHQIEKDLGDRQRPSVPMAQGV